MQLLIRKKFGCQTFVEGKIAKQWGGGGCFNWLAHYQTQFSYQMVNWWTWFDYKSV
jgi:hypothetical protein